jgi:hypothetical protein
LSCGIDVAPAAADTDRPAAIDAAENPAGLATGGAARRLSVEGFERQIVSAVEFGLFRHEPFQFGFGLPALAAREAAILYLNSQLLDLIVGCQHRVSPSV